MIFQILNHLPGAQVSVVTLFPVEIPSLNCEERYFAKFFKLLKISVLPQIRKSKFARKLIIDQEQKV